MEDPNDPEHFGITPDDPGFIDINTITEGAAYSADDEQTAFTPSTLPNSSDNNGKSSGISITNIGPEGLIMTMLVSFGDTYEPNDTIDTAFPIYYSEDYYSFLYDASDRQDYYQVQAAGGKTIRITLTEIPEDKNYRLSLLTASGEIIAIGEKAPDELGYQILFQPATQQTLYLLISSDDRYSSVASYKLSVEQLEPEAFAVVETRVFPNPFRPKTSKMTFDYQLSVSQSAETVSLDLFTANGKKVYNEKHQEVVGAGQFIWNGKNQNGNLLAPGIYIYQITATQEDLVSSNIGKIIILR